MVDRPAQPNTPALRQAIRDALEVREWTASRLAEEAGLPRSTVTRILGRERHTVRRDLLVRMNQALGAGVDLIASSEQLELDLAIAAEVEQFLARAEQVVSKHLQQAQRRGIPERVAKVTGVVSLTIHDPLLSRIHERRFPLPLRWSP